MGPARAALPSPPPFNLCVLLFTGLEGLEAGFHPVHLTADVTGFALVAPAVALVLAIMAVLPSAFADTPRLIMRRRSGPPAT